MTTLNQARKPVQAGQVAVDPASWRGNELAERTDWTLIPTQAQLDDLTAMAAKICASINDDPNGLLRLNRNDFDLGRAIGLTKSAWQLLKDGPGVVLIRGLPLHELRPIEAAVIYWALGNQLGRPTPNNAQGDMLGHVINLGKDMSDPLHRGYQTNATMDFHCDQCDIVGLLCLQTGKSGGESKVVSSVAVYNELVATHPDVIETLREPLYWTMHGEIAPGHDNFYKSPVFNFVDGYLCTAFGPVHIEKGHRLAETPDLTAAQIEAIRITEQTCEALHYAMSLEKGDIQILSNSVALHTRKGFQDWPEPERRRHLWRLWLNNPEIRPASPHLAHWRKGRGIPIPIEKQRIVLSGFA